MSILTIIYLIGSLTFIIGLKMLSHPESARKGNLVAAFGMTIAIFGTIFLYRDEEGHKLHNYICRVFNSQKSTNDCHARNGKFI
jgi:NAD(P) transhydrogenase subunit beta